MNLSMNFSGKVAFVTGAGSPRGIGFAIASLLSKQGAKVAITSTTQRIEDRARELSAQGSDVLGRAADLCQYGRAHALVRDVLARFGRIGILVNNAGMTQIGRPEATAPLPLAELPEQDWDYGIAINLKTTFNITRAVLPCMLEAELRTHCQHFLHHRSGREQSARNRIQRR